MAVNQSFLGNMTPLSANVPAVKKPAVLTPSIARPPKPTPVIPTPPKPPTPTPAASTLVTPSTFMANPAVQATIKENLNFGGITPTEDQVNQAVQARIKNMQAEMGAGTSTAPTVTGAAPVTAGTPAGATTAATSGGVITTQPYTPPTGPGSLVTAPTTTDYTTDEAYKQAETQRAAAASEQFKAEEYARREAEAVNALQQKYDRLRQDAMARSQSQSAERFSNLAGVGVNPLSSGAANVAGDVERNLANEMSNIAIQQASEIAATRAALRGERNAEAEKALNLATSAMERIRQSALDRQAASQQSFTNTMARAKFLAEESRSNYDFSQKQKEDAASEIETMIESSVGAVKAMTPEQKAALEKRAGWLVGAIDARIKKAEEKTIKDEAAAKSKALVAQDKEYIDKGYLPVVGPSELKNLPSGSQIVRGGGGRIYYKPPTSKFTQVSAGATLVDESGKPVYTAPKSSGGGKGGGGSKPTTLEKNYDRYVKDTQERGGTPVSFGDFIDKKGMNTGGGGLDIDALSDDLLKD